MCLATTLALDAAHLGIPTIAYTGDPTGTLHRRHTHLCLDEDGRFYGFEAIPVVNSARELTQVIKDLLNDKGKAAHIAFQMAAQWDFPLTDFAKTLLMAVVGEEGAAVV